MQNHQDEVPTASVGMWILLIAIASVSFWCQATVTEERFVPALNVIANKFNIPDDIAGATLMAAGASSPELFSSFVALFVTHSSLGLGTVFGSEVFNQLIICAGAVYSSQTGRLELNKAVVTREVFFYSLGIATLYIALQDTEPVASDPSGIDHIFVSFWDAVLVFVGYIFYVIVCANMNAITDLYDSCFGGKDKNTTKLKNGGTVSSLYGAIQQGEILVGEDIPFLREKSTNLSLEPAGNFEIYHRTKTGDPSARILGNQTSSMLEQSIRSNMHKFSDGASLRPFPFLLNTEKPSDDHGLFDIEEDTYEDRLSCFMWQRSYFYNKARFAMHGWHLRWFSFVNNKMYSVPDRANFARHRIEYPDFTEIVVDRERHVIKIVNPKSTRRSWYVLAPSEEILTQVVIKMKEIMDSNKQKEKQPDNTLQQTINNETQGTLDDAEHDESDFESMIEFPVGASTVGIFFFFVLFPFRALLHYTVPDVRTIDRNGDPNSTLSTATAACLMCLAWLIVGSYAMVASLEALASLLDIPDAVIGFTVSAAGTSLPNYVASAVAARNGFGNMAVSNALGSNTFNIMMGLGLPWCLYIAFGNNFEPYNELRNEGITSGVLILAAVLLLLVLLLLQSGFVLHTWHGHLFIVSYIAYLVYVIGSVYW